MDDVRTEYSDQPIRYEIENVPPANTTFLWHIATYIMLQRTAYLHSCPFPSFASAYIALGKGIFPIVVAACGWISSVGMVTAYITRL